MFCSSSVGNGRLVVRNDGRDGKSANSNDLPPYTWKQKIANVYVVEFDVGESHYKLVARPKGFGKQESPFKLVMPHTLFFLWESFRHLRHLVWHRMRWVIEIEVVVGTLSGRQIRAIEVPSRAEAFRRVYREADAIQNGLIFG